MKEPTFLKTWSWLALLQLTAAALLFMRTTDSEPASHMFGVVKVSAVSVPAIGMPVDLALGIVLMLMTLAWSLPRRAAIWSERIPLFYFSQADFDSSTPSGKLYKLATLVAAHLLPLAATLQMASRYLAAGVYLRDGEQVIPGGWSHFNYSALSAGALKGMLNFGEPLAPETFAALPWLYALVMVIYLSLALAIVWSVLRR